MNGFLRANYFSNEDEKADVSFEILLSDSKLNSFE
jgi:hypothetical protein